jgi:hypothetical protein
MLKAQGSRLKSKKKPQGIPLSLEPWALSLGLSLGLSASGLALAQAPAVVLDNEHVRVARNHQYCAIVIPGCEQRVLVALGDVAVGRSRNGEDKTRGVVGGFVGPAEQLKRGDVRVLDKNESYTRPEGEYLEVTIRSKRPPIKSPSVLIPPDKNSILHDSEDFFIFEEKLDPGDTRARHSHRERVVIVINKTRLQQWPDGSPAIFRDQIPDDVRFNPPVVHVVKTVGDLPLRNIVIEFKR